MRSIRLALSALVVLILASAPAAAAPTGPGHAAGSYNYHPFGNVPGRSLTVFAEGPAAYKGSWATFDPDTGVVLRAGLVTCLSVDGGDAWMAGPETYRAAGLQAASGAFLHVRDGGAVGPAGDAATTWFADPGQTLLELVGWCRTQNSDLELWALASGDIEVADAD